MTESKYDEEIKKKGFELFCEKDTVRRISNNITAVKGDLDGYHIVELKDGKRICDCFRFKKDGLCHHIYASQLARNAKRNLETEIASSDEHSLKCRYCGSPDVSKCGFRYNARGISRRYYCHECERKFSIRVVENQQSIVNIPSEVVWLLNEIGLLVTKLNESLIQLDGKLTKFQVTQKSE